MSCDLLVIGGGVAGSAAAAHAAERGASVVVVEASERLGGSGALSAGILWTAPDRGTVERVCPHADQRLSMRLVDGFDGAVESAREAGVEVSERWHGQMGYGVAHRIDILGLLDAWRERIEKGGRILFGTRASALVVEDRAVLGAIATGADGSQQRLEADAVVLATGGFQGDGELVRRLIGPHADEMLVRSAPHARGDGIRIGLAAGAALSGSLDSFYGHLLPSPLDDFGEPDYLPLTQYHSKACILVNRYGRRFCDESLGDEVSNQALLRQVDSRAVLLCDESVRKTHAVGAPYPHGQVIDRFAAAQEAGGRFASERTLEGLIETVAGWDVPESALRDTLARYDDAAKGAPAALDAPLPARPEPLRDPPFHALEVQPSLTFTFGGLRADRDGRVLDKGGGPVPGLYAAGADIGGVQETGYLGGLVLGLVFGPLAAEAAITEVNAKELAHG